MTNFVGKLGSQGLNSTHVNLRGQVRASTIDDLNCVTFLVYLLTNKYAVLQSATWWEEDVDTELSSAWRS